MNDELPGQPVEQADVIATAVLGTPGVHGLHSGAFGEVATYLPGRRVTGVRVLDDSCEVHVTLSWGAPFADTSAAVRAALRPLTTGPVDVVVEDVAGPDGPP